MLIGETQFNLLLSLVLSMADVLGMKVKVELDEHKIDLSLISARELKKRAYDDGHYVNGNVFYKNFANPVKAKLDEGKDKLELITSDRYKHFMRMSLLKDLIKSAEGEGMSMETLTLIAIVISGINTALLGFFIFMLFGGM